MKASIKDHHRNRRRTWLRHAPLALLPVAAAGCSDEGISTAEVQQAAKERVRQELALSPESALFTGTYVGRERAGEPVVCGTVSGRRADGTEITPRRFIIGTENSRFLAFGPAHSSTNETANDKFGQWAELCTGANG